MVLLLLLALAQLMVILDISAVNVALPDLAKDLEHRGGDLGWTITSYSLVFGSLLLLGGRAADLLGRRRVFLDRPGRLHGRVARLGAGDERRQSSSPPAPARVSAQRCCPRPRCRSSRPPSRAPSARRRSASGAPSAAPAPRSASCSAARSPSSSTGARSSSSTCPSGSRVAAAAMKVVPADVARPHGAASTSAARWSPPPASAALVYALSQAADAGWTSAQTLGLGARRPRRPRRVRRARAAHRAAAAEHPAARRARRRRRLRDDARRLRRAVRLVPAHLDLPAERARHRRAGDRARVPAHGRRHRRRRPPRQPPHRPRRPADRRSPPRSRSTAAGMLLLAGVDADGSYVADVLPGMLVAGLGLGIALVSVAVSVLTGAADDETGMLSGLEHHRPRDRRLARHRRSSPPSPPAPSARPSASTAGLAGGIGDAFLVAGVIAAVAARRRAVRPAVGRRASCPSCALAPRVAIH